MLYEYALASALLEWRSSTLRGSHASVTVLACVPTFKASPFITSAFLESQQWKVESSQTLNLSDFSFCHISLTHNWRKFSAFKASLNQIGPTQIIQDNIPILRSVTLIISVKHVMWHIQFPGIRAWRCLESILLISLLIAHKMTTINLLHLCISSLNPS